MDKSGNLSFFDKAKLQIQSWSEKFDINITRIIETISYFAVGFFLGFFLKRCFRVVFVSLIILILSLFLLDNLKIIHIDFVKLKSFTGISPEQTIGSLSQLYIEWIKTNIVIVISTISGIILGYKIG